MGVSSGPHSVVHHQGLAEPSTPEVHLYVQMNPNRKNNSRVLEKNRRTNVKEVLDTERKHKKQVESAKSVICTYR